MFGNLSTPMPVQPIGTDNGFGGGHGLGGFVLGWLLGIFTNGRGFGNAANSGECCVTPSMFLSSTADIVNNINGGLANLKDSVVNGNFAGITATTTAASNIKDFMSAGFSTTNANINGISKELCGIGCGLGSKIDHSTASLSNKIETVYHSMDKGFCATNANVDNKSFMLSKQESDNTFALSKQSSDETCKILASIKDLSCQSKEETSLIIANQNALANAAEKKALECRIAQLESQARDRDLDIRFAQINNNSNVAQGAGNTVGVSASDVLTILAALGITPATSKA